MDAIRALLTRRETRKFAPSSKLPDDMLDDLIKAAVSAPSLDRTKPWSFVIVQKRERVRRIAGLLDARDVLAACVSNRC